MTTDNSHPYRRRDLMEALARRIARRVSRIGPVKLMHVCGSHERTASEWGLRDLLPGELELIPGPGCPVCVCAEHEIGEAIELTRRGVTVATFGDMLRVRTKFGSLMEARAEGGDVRVVYSPTDAADLARADARREVVFFAVGFETTAAPVAGMVCNGLPGNFSLHTALKLTSPAVEALVVGGGAGDLKGLIAPGHVSTIVGANDWKVFPEKYGLPVVVSGFEPVDLLAGIEMLLEAIEEKEVSLGNEYTRLVQPNGNPSAKRSMAKAFEVNRAFWRAVGWVDRSGLFLRDEFADFDAKKKYDLDLSEEAESTMPKGCLCHLVVLGKAYPSDCPLFGTRCTLLEPVGPCMVSEEGACRIWHRFGESRRGRA